MKTVITIDDETLDVYVNEHGEAHVKVDCPHCSKPLRVIGGGMHIGGHDFYQARGFCHKCKKEIGTIKAYVSTIFGLEEDERMIHQSRCRVY